MTTATHVELALLLEEQARRQSRRTLDTLFPDTGPLRRDLYPKHLEFFRAGGRCRQRLFLAANRVGKTRGACYEDALHLTGQYPAWWEGKRFRHPVKMWVCGTTDEKVKETVQEELLGPVGAWGTGLIPGDSILGTDKASGATKDLVDTVRVRHGTGGTSTLVFKSYKQGRTAFEGTLQHVIHGDEEMPADIKTECLLRTTDTSGTGQGNGLLLLTFTPLLGLCETVLSFLPDGQLPTGEQTGSTYVVNATWDDVPHLDEATKAELRKAIPPYQLDARTRGLPVLGAGAIYPVDELSFLVDDFPLPPHWKRAYGLDVGWQRTAAIWGAYDPESDCWTLFHEHYVGQQEPTLHAAAIRAPGAWVAGVIDPAARGRGQVDGEALLDLYTDLGLHLEPAENAVEAGLYAVWERLSTGRLKVFRSLSNWRKEQRIYHRDDKGHVVKRDDHLMDATRYLIMSGQAVAKPVPVAKAPRERQGRGGPGSWMA